ncbi:hypothetical protein LX32DRAFT_137753 [Colletotrichum zoysiae]|uniref:Uncharacterized protein n=1 Tax=Colletotrichum zoysiae TaxID=1216348 RepID=A0AAD9M4G3_9PEZI|nr:hypothetical protein LX32DRAFT_137753 [Colletotrichum zoysiae]
MYSRRPSQGCYAGTADAGRTVLLTDLRIRSRAFWEDESRYGMGCIPLCVVLSALADLAAAVRGRPLSATSLLLVMLLSVSSQPSLQSTAALGFDFSFCPSFPPSPSSKEVVGTHRLPTRPPCLPGSWAARRCFCIASRPKEALQRAHWHFPLPAPGLGIRHSHEGTAWHGRNGINDQTCNRVRFNSHHSLSTMHLSVSSFLTPSLFSSAFLPFLSPNPIGM